jgi:hypothetical protein
MEGISESLVKLQRRDPTIRFRYDDMLKTFSYLHGNLADYAVDNYQN